MPLIKWQCLACRETFESFMRLREAFEDGPPCPRCEHPFTRTGEAPEGSNDRAASGGLPPGG